MVSRTVNFSERRVSCREMPSHWRSSRGFVCQLWPRIMTWPEVGLEQALQDFDGGGLPCTVWPEQAETFPGFDLEVQPANGLDLAVVSLPQVAALDGRGHAMILTERQRRRLAGRAFDYKQPATRCARRWRKGSRPALH